MELEVIREIDDARLSALTSLFEAARERDNHEPLGEHKWLDLVHPRTGDTPDPEGRRAFAGVVGREGEAIVGYAHLSRHHKPDGAQWGLEVVIHPDHRGKGAEEALLRRAIEIVTEEDGGHVHWWVFQPADAHDDAAKNLGFRKGRDLLHMKVRLPLGIDPRLPDGVRVRSFEPGRDEDDWIEVNNRAFAHHPEQGAWDRDTLDRRMAEDWFDPEGFLLATDDAGKVIGFCWTKINPSCGEIYVIGVDPSQHGSGLGKALAIAGLDHLAKTGLETGCLYVDSSEAAPVKLYEKLGFEIDHFDRAYTKDV